MRRSPSCEALSPGSLSGSRSTSPEPFKGTNIWETLTGTLLDNVLESYSLFFNLPLELVLEGPESQGTKVLMDSPKLTCFSIITGEFKECPQGMHVGEGN